MVLTIQGSWTSQAASRLLRRAKRKSRLQGSVLLPSLIFLSTTPMPAVSKILTNVVVGQAEINHRNLDGFRWFLFCCHVYNVRILLVKADISEYLSNERLYCSTFCSNSSAVKPLNAAPIRHVRSYIQ